ncbi:uncharacterized protein LOC116853879 isoform X2 [Odontomachus brunneus]|uniref:uncharacterized protein LOC116853879 isoform X2 n=1 Tax=Odontomachus brunneus TaxID=486640 RepID=UPI0013F26F7D|nr:uncharacterized protein LOC116853879 isoform X2 [Odontomachus brunneus]
MCDHCAKITSQKGYAGQVTCRCGYAEKKDDSQAKEKDIGGCCSKKAREIAGGCCMSGCCMSGKVDKSKSESKPGCCENDKQAKKDGAGGCCEENHK